MLLSLICLRSLITDESEVSLSKAVYYQTSTLISLCYWCCVNQPSFKRYKCERKRNDHQLCHVIGGIKSFSWLHQNYMWKIVRVVQNVLSLHMIIIRQHYLLTAEWFPQINMCPLLLHIFVGTWLGKNGRNMFYGNLYLRFGYECVLKGTKLCENCQNTDLH